MRRSIMLLSAGLITLLAGAASAQNDKPRNLILFIPDGLRALKVTPETAPAMAEVRDNGVNFKNPHSLFPTFTTANASAMATGHYLGDTGDFSNTIYTGYPVAHANGTVTPFLEVDPVILDIDEHFGGDYLNEETILKMARAKGYSTAAIGKLGPTLIFDHTDKTGDAGLHSIVIDDATGGKNGVPISDEMKVALTKANLPLATPSRGDNGKAGDARTPGTLVPNTAQQAWFADVASKIVLPMFRERGKPFVLPLFKPSPVLRDAAGSSYVFRLTGALPASKPGSIDEVADAVQRDWRSARAYELAMKRARELLEAARKSSLTSAAKESNLKATTTGQFDLMATTIEGVSLPPEALAKFRFDALGLLGTAATQPTGPALRLIELPIQGKIFVAQLLTAKPRIDTLALPMMASGGVRVTSGS